MSLQDYFNLSEIFPHRCHLLGAYALGKCQRVMSVLRRLGYEETIYLHGAQVKLVELYEQFGVDLGHWRKVSEVEDKKALAGSWSLRRHLRWPINGHASCRKL